MIPDEQRQRAKLMKDAVDRLRTTYPKLTLPKLAKMLKQIAEVHGGQRIKINKVRLGRLINGQVKVTADEWNALCWTVPDLECKWRNLVLDWVRKGPPDVPRARRSDKLEKRLAKEFAQVQQFYVPEVDSELATYRLCAEYILEELKSVDAAQHVLALSGGRSQFLVMDELQKLIESSQAQFGRKVPITFVATNDFRDPTQPQFSATSITTLLANRFDGKAVHATPVGDDSADKILSRPTLALLGAGNRNGFVCSKCIAPNVDVVGDYAGVPLTLQKVDMSGQLVVNACQNLSLNRINVWTGGSRTTVCIVVPHREKRDIAEVILRGRLANNAFLSAELAQALLDKTIDGERLDRSN